MNTHDDLLAARGLRPIRPRTAADTEPVEAGASEPTTEERVLASDEPLEVRPVQLDICGWAVFLGADRVSHVFYPSGGDSAAADYWRDAAERWRADIRKRLRSAVTNTAIPEAFAALRAADPTQEAKCKHTAFGLRADGTIGPIADPDAAQQRP